MTPVSEPQPNGWSCLHSPNNAMEFASSANNVMVSPDNRGLSYADGFFTTMGVMDSLILWQDYHHQRLISHAHALQLYIDDQALLLSLQSHAKQLQQGMLKLIITRASQAVRGYGFTPSESGSACEVWLKSSALSIVTAEQLHLPDGRSILMQPDISAVCLKAQIACLPPPLAGLKSLNRLDNVLASGELQAIKANTSVSSTELGSGDIGEGLLRDMTGSWVEGTMSNVFYQLSSNPLAEPKNFLNDNKHNADYLTTGQWYTPSMAQSGVAGVMRQVIMDSFAKSENPIQIRALNDEDLPHLSRLFFCNALRGIMPVTSLTLLSSEVVGF